MGQKTALNLNIDSLLQEIFQFLAISTSKIDRDIGYNFANGALADQADEVITFESNIAISGEITIDLTAFLNAFGVAVNLTNVKALLIKSINRKITVGSDGAMPFTAPWFGVNAVNVINAGGTLLLVAPDLTGFDVGPGTADDLKIKNLDGSNTADFEILLFGVRT